MGADSELELMGARDQEYSGFPPSLGYTWFWKLLPTMTLCCGMRRGPSSCHAWAADSSVVWGDDRDQPLHPIPALTFPLRDAHTLVEPLPLWGQKQRAKRTLRGQTENLQPLALLPITAQNRQSFSAVEVAWTQKSSPSCTVSKL